MQPLHHSLSHYSLSHFIAIYKTTFSLSLSIRECATYVVKKTTTLSAMDMFSLYLYMCSISASLRSCHWNTWFSRSAKCISSCVIKCPVSPLLQVLLPANSKLLVLVLVDGKCDSLLFVHTLIVSIFFGRCKKKCFGSKMRYFKIRERPAFLIHDSARLNGRFGKIKNTHRSRRAPTI